MVIFFVKLFKYVNNYLNYNVRIGQTLKWSSNKKYSDKETIPKACNTLAKRDSTKIIVSVKLYVRAICQNVSR